MMYMGNFLNGLINMNMQSRSAPGASTRMMALLGVLVVFPVLPMNAQSLELLSDEESQALTLETRDLHLLPNYALPAVTRSGPAGPSIVVLSPEATTTVVKNRPVLQSGSPVNLSVEFHSTGSPVDMASLVVKAVKFGFTKDLTPLLKDYVVDNSVQANNVEVNSGKYRIIVSVADERGRVAQKEYILHIT